MREAHENNGVRFQHLTQVKPEGSHTCISEEFLGGVEGASAYEGYVELPYTLPRDFTLFVLMREKNIDTWKRKLDWIAEHGGMALINTHPDYMHFGNWKPRLEEYPVRYYEEFLGYVKQRYEGEYWHVLPRDMARFWVSDVVKNSAED